MWLSGTIFTFTSIVVFSVGLEYNETQSKSTVPVDVKRMIDEQCKIEYSMTCFKLDLAALVPNLSTARNYRLLPGLFLETGGFNTNEPEGQLPLEAVEPALDRYLIKGLDSFLNSISLRVKVMDKVVAERVHNLGQSFVGDIDRDDKDVSGRGRRKRINNALMMGGMVSAGTLLALTMSAVSAMAGKAILVSLLSLAMTLMGNRAQGGGGGGGGGQGKTSYEIITHTVPHHDDYSNRHWPHDIPESYHFVKSSPTV